MSANVIVVIAAMVTAIASVAIAGAAWKQLPLIAKRLKIDGERQKQWATVTACQRYVTDPILREAKREIWTARDNGKKITIDHPEAVRQDVYILLNYFDTIAIGINQGIYNENIVYDNLRYIIEDAVLKFVYKRSGDFQVKEEHFSDLITLYHKWFAQSAQAGTVS